MMKTDQKFKFLLFIGLSISLLGFSQSKSEKLDFYVKFLTGEWKEYKVCGGYAGGCEMRSMLKESFTPIEETTDSLLWKTYYFNTLIQQTKTKVCFEKSELSQDSAWIINSNFGQYRITYKDNNLLILSMEAWDGQGSYYSREIASGIHENEGLSTDFVLFPIPCGNMLNISYNENFDEIKIFDLNNRLITVNPLKNCKQASIDLSGLQSGTYIIQIQIKNKVQRKIVIKNQ